MSVKWLELHGDVLHTARLGDPVALARLLELSKPDIRRYAQRHCLISDVDDAVQETLLVLSRKLSSLRVLAAFSSWVFRTVQRECRRLGRVALKFDPYDEVQLEQWLHVHNTDQLRMELIQALASLPITYREVILMRDMEEMTIAEMGEQLSLTSAAVKSRLHRARSLARKYLLT